MASIIKSNTYADFNGREILTANNDGILTTQKINQPFFSTTLSSNQTVSTGTWTKMNFDSEIVDTNNAFNTTDKQFVVPANCQGKYLIFSMLYRNFSTNGTNIRAAITKNDSRVINSIFTDGQGIANSAIVSAVMDLAVGDTIHIETFHDRGSNETYATDHNQFYGFRIGS